MRGRGRVRRAAPNRNIATTMRAVRNEGHFNNFMPMDPPNAFKSGWKAIRLEEALGSTSVTLTTGNIRDALTSLGIAANAVKLQKVAVWVMPSSAANGGVPQVNLSLNDPVTRGTLGTRGDTGQLSRSAKVSYSFSDAVREHSLDLPAAGQAGITYALIETSAASGVFQISLEYNI